jgi:Dyp-type peroxidase family
VARVRIDQRDVQGNVLAGYGFDHGLFLVVRVKEPAGGRAWLRELAADVTTAMPFGDPKPRHALNVAITHDGLRALEVPDAVLGSFPEAFVQGMAARAAKLGDTGPDSPAYWEVGIRAGEPHVLVTVNAQSAEVLAERRDLVKQRIVGDPALALVHEVVTGVIAKLGAKKVVLEHFGFADGLAQPSIAGYAEDNPNRRVGPHRRDGQGTPVDRSWRNILPGVERRWKPLAPGEFVLGYPDEAGQVADKPVQALRRNGSYMVLRKLRQDVALFHNYLREAADNDSERMELLAAKVVGRWRDGTPLMVESKKRPPPRDENWEPPTDFRYGSDPRGLACPWGAHIRRANPRDALGFKGRLASRHRIVRRGMPYGPPAADPFVEDGIDRGLMFVCYQAGIARQFEVIQGAWLADGDALGLGTDRDFLLGGDDPHGKMTIPGDPPQFLAPTRSFVTNRGGGYFFVPGIAALGRIAEGIRTPE